MESDVKKSRNCLCAAKAPCMYCFGAFLFLCYVSILLCGMVNYGLYDKLLPYMVHHKELSFGARQ